MKIITTRSLVQQTGIEMTTWALDMAVVDHTGLVLDSFSGQIPRWQVTDPVAARLAPIAGVPCSTSLRKLDETLTAKAQQHTSSEYLVYRGKYALPNGRELSHEGFIRLWILEAMLDAYHRYQERIRLQTEVPAAWSHVLAGSIPIVATGQTEELSGSAAKMAVKFWHILKTKH